MLKAQARRTRALRYESAAALGDNLGGSSIGRTDPGAEAPTPERPGRWRRRNLVVAGRAGRRPCSPCSEAISSLFPPPPPASCRPPGDRPPAPAPPRRPDFDFAGCPRRVSGGPPFPPPPPPKGRLSPGLGPRLSRGDSSGGGTPVESGRPSRRFLSAGRPARASGYARPGDPSGAGRRETRGRDPMSALLFFRPSQAALRGDGLWAWALARPGGDGDGPPRSAPPPGAKGKAGGG